MPRKRILICDDDLNFRMVVEHALSSQGFDVAPASTGPEALVRVEEGNVDAILLDLNLPGMSGIEVLERLKGKLSTQKIPVLVLTADDDFKQVTRCMRLGAREYIAKPVKLGQLVKTLERVLGITGPTAPAAPAIAAAPPAFGVSDRPRQADAQAAQAQQPQQQPSPSSRPASPQPVAPALSATPGRGITVGGTSPDTESRATIDELRRFTQATAKTVTTLKGQLARARALHRGHSSLALLTEKLEDLADLLQEMEEITNRVSHDR